MKRRSRSVSGILLLCSLLLTLSLPAKVGAFPSHPFSDIRGSSYEEVIATLYDMGVVNGLEAEKFVPSGLVTRAQMATLIVRAMGKSNEANQLATLDSGFSDVGPDHWARGTVVLANRMGIVKGDAGRFNPNDPVNYAQVTTMLVRALGYEDKVEGGYPSGYVLKANELGLLAGLKFDLYGNVTRAEAARYLYNAIFAVPQASTGLTWSQTIFKRAKTITFGELPTYLAPGQTVKLGAAVADLAGKPIPDAAVTYTVLQGNAQVQNQSLLVRDSGTITVKAAYGDLAATATVTAVTNLAISPDTFQANKGGTLQLTATAQAGSQRVSVQPVWKVTGPATITDQGLLTVNDYGTVTVQATMGTLSAEATGQAVGRISITQKPDYLVPGQPATFAAVAQDSRGQAISVPITWSATNATIDSTSGRLINPTGSQVTVKATAGGISTEVTVPVLQSIVLSPSSAVVLSGKQVTFTATGMDASGRQYPIQPRWDRSNAAIGIIDAQGTFAGTGSGTTNVVATLGSLIGQAEVRVSGPPAALRVAASNVTLPANSRATSTITVRLLDATGATSAVDDQPVSLTITDSGNGTLSRGVVLTRQGEATVTYTSGSTPGTAVITASVPGTGMANQVITLTTYQQAPSNIQLTATPQPLATGGGVATITATLRDNNTFPVVAPTTLYVTLNTSGLSNGSLTGNIITIPAGQTSGTVNFLSGSQAGWAQISGTSSYPVNGIMLQMANAGPAAGVKIRPITDATPVTGLSSLQVLVDVVDAAGVVRATDNTTQVHLSVSGQGGPTSTGGTPATFNATAVNGTATFQVPAYAVGKATLTASLVANSAATDTATAEFVPGVLSSLRLTAQPATIVADGVSQTQIIAEVIDRAGNLVPNVNPVVTFRKLVEGNATTATTPLVVQASGGRAILSVVSTRTAGSDTWHATAPGLDTQNLATVTTTAGSGDAYTMRVWGATSFAVGTSNTLLIQVIDQQGRVVTNDIGRTISVSHSIPGVTVTPTATTQNGAATFAIVGNQATSGTITFTTTGIPIPTLQVPVAFGTAGGAYSLFGSTSQTSARIGQSVSISVRVMDSQGNVVLTDTGRTITASVNGSATLTPQQASTQGGMAVFNVIGTGVGTVVVTITAPGLPQPTITQTITFTN